MARKQAERAMVAMPSPGRDHPHVHPAMPATELLGPGSGPPVFGSIAIGLGHGLLRLSVAPRLTRQGHGRRLINLPLTSGARTLGVNMLCSCSGGRSAARPSSEMQKRRVAG